MAEYCTYRKTHRKSLARAVAVKETLNALNNEFYYGIGPENVVGWDVQDSDDGTEIIVTVIFYGSNPSHYPDY